jgi:hypothetical protein
MQVHSGGGKIDSRSDELSPCAWTTTGGRMSFGKQPGATAQAPIVPSVVQTNRRKKHAGRLTPTLHLTSSGTPTTSGDDNHKDEAPNNQPTN